MTTIDLSPPAKLFGVEPIPPQTLGQAVATHVLANVAKGPAMKLMSWANKLNANQPLELDSTDFCLLQDLVEKSEVLLNFAKGPVLEIMVAAKKSE